MIPEAQSNLPVPARSPRALSPSRVSQDMSQEVSETVLLPRERGTYSAAAHLLLRLLCFSLDIPPAVRHGLDLTDRPTG